MAALNDTAELEARQSKDKRETLKEIVERTEEMNENLKNISHFLPAIRDRKRCGIFFSPENAVFYVLRGVWALAFCVIRLPSYISACQIWADRRSGIMGKIKIITKTKLPHL